MTEISILRTDFRNALWIVALSVVLTAWFLGFLKRSANLFLKVLVGVVVFLTLFIAGSALSYALPPMIAGFGLSDHTSEILRIASFFLCWALCAFLGYQAVNPQMNPWLRGLLGILLGYGICHYLFSAAGLWQGMADDGKGLPALAEIRYTTGFRLVLAGFWLAASALCYPAFQPKMNRFQRSVLSLVCGILLTAMMKATLYQLLGKWL